MRAVYFAHMNTSEHSSVDRQQEFSHGDRSFNTMETTTTTERNSGSDTSPRSFVWYALLALGLALFIRFFIAAPYVVSGASMEPTFNNWDYLITDRLSYRVGEPERGDVIVFCLPGQSACSLTDRIAEGQVAAPRTLIKRIIGLPGDTVIVNSEGVRIINESYSQGLLLAEPYLDPTNYGGPTGMSITLQPDEFFVLGDNRKVSSDSRTWGVLPREDIVGRVFVRLFPLSQAETLPGDANYADESAQEDPPPSPNN